MVHKEYDVTALGELLIDFTENGISSQGNILLELIQAVPRVMYWRCLENLVKKQRLSERSGRISLAIC